MKTKHKVLTIAGLISFFIIFDLSFFFSFTYIVLPNKSEAMRAKSIEIGEYLPFEEETKIIKKKDSLEFEGEKPVIDCATALYPVASAFAYSLYEPSDIHFEDNNFAEDSKLQLQETEAASKD